MSTEMLAMNLPQNFSFEACLGFLDRGFNECLYHVEKDKVSRLIRLRSGLAFVVVSVINNKLNIKVDKEKISQADKDEVYGYVADWFDIKRDISSFYQMLEQNQSTQNFSKQYHGLRLMGIVDLFEALCWCVIGQQINLTFAHKVKTRLVHKFGEKVNKSGVDYYCFPTPETLVKVEQQDLVEMQFSKQKINYIINISQAFTQGQLDKNDLLVLTKDEQMSRLTAIKGIGPWTANYASMKSLRDMTCIAYGDTGLSTALHKRFATDKKPKKATIDKIFKPFSGWESYLNFYLWRSLGDL